MFAIVFIASIFFYVGLNANHSFKLNNDTVLWRRIVGWSLIIIGALSFLVNCIIQIITEGDLDFTSYSFAMGWVLSFPFIIWGIYTLTSSKAEAPIWKRIILGIIYSVMTFFMMGTANVNFNIASISFIIVMINSLISLGMNYKPERFKSKETKNTQKEIVENSNQNILDKSDYSSIYKPHLNYLKKDRKKPDDIFTRLDNYSEKMVNKLLHNIFKNFGKIIGSVLIPGFFFFCILNCLNYEMWGWNIFYFPYYITLIIYFEKLLWKKRKQIGDFLLVPLLQKMDLFMNELTTKDKKIIIVTILPSLLLSCILPSIGTLIVGVSHYYYDSGLIHFLLIVPVILWIISLAINYSYEWIKKENQNDIAHV